jgi:hypothetical protein
MKLIRNWNRFTKSRYRLSAPNTATFSTMSVPQASEYCSLIFWVS